MQLKGRWLAELDPRTELAARSFFHAAKRPAPHGDRLALWLRTAPEGKRLLAAFAAIDALPLGAARLLREEAAGRTWLGSAAGSADDVHTWLLAHKEGKAIRAAALAFIAAALAFIAADERQAEAAAAAKEAGDHAA